MQHEESLDWLRRERRKALGVFTGAVALEVVDSTLFSAAPDVIKLAVGVISVGAAFCESFPLAFYTLDIWSIKHNTQMDQTVLPLKEPDLNGQEEYIVG